MNTYEAPGAYSLGMSTTNGTDASVSSSTSTSKIGCKFMVNSGVYTSVTARIANPILPEADLAEYVRV